LFTAVMNASMPDKICPVTGEVVSDEYCKSFGSGVEHRLARYGMKPGCKYWSWERSECILLEEV